MTTAGATIWRCGDRVLDCGRRPLVMGILNVTPDSFSDGGLHAETEKAVAHGLRMVQDGADIIDVGGESTRPGAQPVPAGDEIRRVVPVIRGLRRESAVPISVDTMKAAVAEAAIEAGADIVNDVAAMERDPRMAAVARASGAGIVLMHMKGEPRTMQERPVYDDAPREVGAYLAGRVAALEQAGIGRERLAVDPGIGFGKTVEHNLQLLARLDELAAIGRPVMVGLSRKSFLGKITGRPVEDRLAASLAGLAFAVMRGARIIRVHDVRESADAVRVLAALTGEPGGWNS